MQDKFYVGARVVCVDDSKGNPNAVNTLPIKKGKIYEVFGIKMSKCCKRLLLDIGIVSNASMTICICNAMIRKSDSTCWIRAERFRLLEPDTELSELSINELLDEILDNDKKVK